MIHFPPIPPPLPILDLTIERALHEDLAGGDLTTEACVDADTLAFGTFVARSGLIVAGRAVAERVFQLLGDVSLEFTRNAEDGERVDEGGLILGVRGHARNLLMGERVAVNFLQRLSGIATLTRRFVDAVPDGCTTRIVDTRKTTPGLRAFERYAVRCGGGMNHRDTLGSTVLIKDNHIVASGSIATAIARARQRAPHVSRIECEVDTIEQLREALVAGAEVVLLDNMSDALVAEAVAEVRSFKDRHVIIEASGGITLARIAPLALAGVDVISVGALTHSPPAADIGLDFSH